MFELCVCVCLDWHELSVCLTLAWPSGNVWRQESVCVQPSVLPQISELYYCHQPLA